MHVKMSNILIIVILKKKRKQWKAIHQPYCTNSRDHVLTAYPQYHEHQLNLIAQRNQVN